ncbi:hypothetical protein MRX96_050402 [Rhipicephalus microplus]
MYMGDNTCPEWEAGIHVITLQDKVERTKSPTFESAVDQSALESALQQSNYGVEEVPDRTEGFGRRGGSGGGDAIELAHHSPTDTHCYSEGTGYHTTSDFVSLESYSVYRRCCDDYYYQAPDTDYTKYETTCDYHTCDSKQNTSVDYSPHDSE